MLLRKVGREQGLFQTPDGPRTLLDSMESEQTATEENTRQEVPHHELPLQEVSHPEFPHREVPRPKAEPRKRGVQIQWHDIIKEKLRGVARNSERTA